MFMVILIMVLVRISHCNGDTCSCICCTGNFCKPALQGNITVPSCASSPCHMVCKAKYPTQCTDGAGSTKYQCTSGNLPTPNWVGTFIMANRCDTRMCCCPSGEMILSRVDANYLRAQCMFTGAGCPVGPSHLDQTIATPSDFSTTVEFLGNHILVTLSQDSRTMQFSNPLFPTCSETATRNGALSTSTINLAFVFLLSGLLSFKQLMM